MKYHASHLSLPGLAAAVWLACLTFLGLLAGMMIAVAWHPHFLPVTIALTVVIVTGLALIIGATWRIVRGPGRRRALSCLLIGALRRSGSWSPSSSMAWPLEPSGFIRTRWRSGCSLRWSSR